MNDMIMFGLGQLPEDRVRKVNVDIMTICVSGIRSLWMLLGDVDIHLTDARLLSSSYK